MLLGSFSSKVLSNLSFTDSKVLLTETKLEFVHVTIVNVFVKNFEISTILELQSCINCYPVRTGGIKFLVGFPEWLRNCSGNVP